MRSSLNIYQQEMLGVKVVEKNKIHALCSLFPQVFMFPEIIEHIRYSVFISKFLYRTISAVF
jgi:hypothetical protein